jgi:cation:H+ antiporter
LAPLNADQLPIWLNGLIVATAIVVIGVGAHWIVDSATRIARRLHISELVIGLTVVAAGTSAPEFAVTLVAAFRDRPDISVGNIVGSNIFNLGFILGGAALFRAIPTNSTLLWRDGSVLAVTALILVGMVGLDLRLDHHDGLILFVLLLAYLTYLFVQRKEIPRAERLARQPVVEAGDRLRPLRDGALLLFGLGIVVGGSHFLIESASAVARHFGVSEWVIGVTIVAAGTSVPEFATSIAGVLKGRYGLSAGNVIGSDIYNLLGVLGLAGILRPLEVDPMARISLMALFGMVLVVLVFMRSGWRLSRLEGLALLMIGLIMWGLNFGMRIG